MTALLVDVNNMAYRAMFTLGGLSHDGQDTSVIYGVLKMIVSLLHRYPEVSSILGCFDYGTPQFRKELIPEYKENRSERNDFDKEVLYRQIDALADIVLPLHGISTAKIHHVEADDLISQATRILDGEIMVVSSDQDLLQLLVHDGVRVLNPAKDKVYSRKEFVDEFAFPPEYYVLYKVMVGDSSDNVPGVKGIGPVAATKVCKAFKNMGLPPRQHVPTDIIAQMPELSVRQRHSLFDFADRWWDTYEVYDLSVDLCDVRKDLLKTPWKPATKAGMFAYYRSKAFISLADMETMRLFMRLEELPWADARCPAVGR